MAEEIKGTADTEEEENRAEESQEAREEDKKVIEDRIEILRILCRGQLKLFAPLRAAGHDVETPRYDFVALTTNELLDALDDTETINSSPFAITNRQAMAIFAATAGKCTDDLDARDIMDRLSGVDAIKAVQLAKLFWNASHRAGNKNISSF